jgi:hypothetical protein
MRGDTPVLKSLNYLIGIIYGAVGSTSFVTNTSAINFKLQFRLA